MKKSLSIVLALGFVALVAISAGAAEKKAPAHAAAKMIKGDVVAVDAAAKTVTVKEAAADIKLAVNDKTVITSGKSKKTLADVKAKDKVKAEYKVEGAVNAALKIEIEAAAPVSAAPKKPVKK